MSLAITSTALTAKAGQSQMFPLLATGGTGVVSWELVDTPTALPPGVQLSGTGALTGAPQCSGVFSFRLRAFDSSAPFPLYAVATVTLTVNP